MSKLLSIFKCCTLLVVALSFNFMYAAPCGDLFISEYIEGGGNNKCVEIYNPTASDIDLAAGNYNIFISINGGTSSSTIDLTGSITADDVYVVCNTSATTAFTAQADQTSGSISFNGNDVVLLRKNTTNIDAFGQIGNSADFAKDHTYVRKQTIQEGDTNDSDAFDITVEWDEYAKDESSYLGSHTMDACSVVAGGCDELFLAEYIEGGSFNKAIEIYNPTDSDIDLGAGLYSLALYSGTATSPSQTFDLTGTVASGDVFVVSHASADAAIANESDETSNAVINFNGDDIIALRKDGINIDVFGQIGSSGNFAKDHTYVRKPNITTGDADGSDAFDTATEWNEFPKDNTDYIGSHTSDCIVIACTISDVTVDNISTCDNNGTDEDASDDTFTFDVTVTFTDPPATGSLDLTGDGTATVDVANLDSPTSHTFGGVIGSADGGSIDVSVAFSEVTACNGSDNTQTAPAACSFNPCGDLFFSEYIEGSGNSKCVEVYNPTGNDIDLEAEGYAVEIYSNGSTSAGTTLALTGMIISGGTHVLCDDGSVTDIFNKADQITTAGLWNGDDAVVLVRGSITLDVIGKIGEDPGSEWNENGVGTANETLRRKASILEGDKSGGDDFDPSLEWDSYPSNNNDNLGVHVSDCISCDIEVKITGNGDFCAGESAMLDAGVYEPLLNVYEWSNGAMTQTIDTDVPGTYMVTVTNDAGCQGTSEITVNALASFEVTADSEQISQTGTGLQAYQIEICGGKLPYTLDLDATGGFATAFQLFAGANCRTIVVQYDQIVDWVLTVNDGNECGPIVIDSEDLVTTEYGALSILTTEVIKETCPSTLDGGLTIEIQGGDNSCGSYDIEWSGPNYTSTGTVDVATLPASVSLSGLGSGVYSVTITDCAGQTLSTSIGVGRKNNPRGGRGRGRGSVNCNPVSADKAAITHSSIDFVELSPNPFSQNAQLQFGLSITAKVVVDIYTIDGRKAANVFSGTVEEGQNNTFMIDGSDLAAGMYVLRLTTDSGVVHHEKLYVSK